MTERTCSCCEHVQHLKQQVLVMRKEIKNLRQYVDSSVRAHRKHVASLQSTLTDVLEHKQTMTNIPSSSSSSSSSSMSAAGTELSLERGHIRTVPIGYITSCFAQKNGTPRQPTICSSSRARLKIQSSVFNNPEHALIGLNQYTHVWLIFLFHKNGHMSCKAKVKPPRLNGKKVGLYSTRSPHRPNAIGLTLAKLDNITGDVLHLSGVDLISGTPVLDIKPYISEYDSPVTRTMDTAGLHNLQEGHCNTLDTLERVEPTEQKILEIPHLSSQPNAEERLGEVTAVLEEVEEFLLQGALCLQSSAEGVHTDVPVTAKEKERDNELVCELNSGIASWIRKPPVHKLSVRFTPTAERQLANFLPPHCSDPGRPKFQFFKGREEAAAAIQEVLSADPRSVYRRNRCSDRLFFFSLDTAHITCWFGDGFAEVLWVQPVTNAES